MLGSEDWRTPEEQVSKESYLKHAEKLSELLQWTTVGSVIVRPIGKETEFSFPTLAAMGTSKYNPVLFVIELEYTSDDSTRIRILDTNGIEHFDVLSQGYKLVFFEDRHWVGVGKYRPDIQKAHLIIFKTRNRSFTLHRRSRSGMTAFSVTDSVHQVVATCNRWTSSTLQINLNKNLKATQKKLILAAYVNIMYYASRNFLAVPKVDISVPLDLEPAERDPHASMACLDSLIVDTLNIRAAGYDRTKNIIYHDVTSQSDSTVLLTLELTPHKRTSGFAKLVAKDRRGKETFSAVRYLPTGLLAMYSPKHKSLFAYQWQRKVMDRNDRLLMHIEAVSDLVGWTTFHVYKRFAQGHSRTYTVGQANGGVKIIIDPSKKKEASTIQTAALVSFCANLFSTVYQDQPLPEIVYKYEHECFDLVTPK